MTNADCASVNVHFARVKAEFDDVGEDDHTEGFVDLPHCDFVSLHVCLFENLTEARTNADLKMCSILIVIIQ